MTGSDRLPNSTETQLRAPYAAPRDSGSREFTRDAASRTSVHAEGRAVAAMLAPFVPREFRDVANYDVSMREQAHRNVTVVPVVERASVVSPDLSSQKFFASAAELPASTDVSLENKFGAIADDEGQVSQFDDVHAPSESTADLPWIDAFAVDASEPEDTWPMGEAGKRLDELTQSLTSLDASRARQQADSDNAESVQSAAAESEHEMWNDEEWIDIMPTPLPASSSAELHNLISEAEANVAPLNDQPGETTPVGAESTARALEGLAQRVRAGKVQVPSFKAEMAEEAVLAGLLASMLGWRQ